MRKIPLTQGKFAIVDDEDYLRVSKHKWCAYKCGNVWYAHTNQKQGGKWIPVRMHRFIMNAKKGDMFDHRNRNGLDNQKRNIRKCTYSQNNRNTQKRKNSKSKFKGVSLNKGKYWYAKIQFEKRGFYLGCFGNEIKAAKAYDKKAVELFGEFANLNFKGEKIGTCVGYEN